MNLAVKDEKTPKKQGAPLLDLSVMVVVLHIHLTPE